LLVAGLNQPANQLVVLIQFVAAFNCLSLFLTLLGFRIAATSVFRQPGAETESLSHHGHDHIHHGIQKDFPAFQDRMTSLVRIKLCWRF
jgi:hypothetical protein